MTGRKPALAYRQSLAVAEFVSVCYIASSAYAREITPACDGWSIRAFDCCGCGTAEKLVLFGQGHQKFLRCPVAGQQHAFGIAVLSKTVAESSLTWKSALKVVMWLWSLQSPGFRKVQVLVHRSAEFVLQLAEKVKLNLAAWCFMLDRFRWYLSDCSDGFLQALFNM